MPPLSLHSVDVKQVPLRPESSLLQSRFWKVTMEKRLNSVKRDKSQLPSINLFNLSVRIVILGERSFGDSSIAACTLESAAKRQVAKIQAFR